MSSSFVPPFPSRPASIAAVSRPLRPLGAKVALVVRDLDRAVDFWCRALGFELRLRIGDTWAEVASGGFVVGLLRDASAGSPLWSAVTPTITIEVDDLERALTAVRARGVSVGASTGVIGAIGQATASKKCATSAIPTAIVWRCASGAWDRR